MGTASVGANDEGFRALKGSLFAAGLCVLWSLTACTSGPSAGTRDVDYSATISELRELMQSETERLGIPCASIALVDGTRIVWEEGFGYQGAEDGQLTRLVEWFFGYPLDRARRSAFTLPGYGLYASEKLEFIENADGRVVEARLGTVSFPTL